MGLITDKGCAKYAVLSDILGDEDHLGDMDFKVTGTRDGITATQMDIKVDGLSYEIMEQALEQAKRGRMHIMDIITETMPAPREDLKPHAPRIVTVTIDKDQIGALIGPGGKIIQDIQEKSGATINIEEVGNKGIVDVAATNKESIDLALARIRAIVAKPEVGEVYDGVVKSIMPFGAFVEILPGKDGLLHVSEIDYKRIEKVEDVLKEGDRIQVKLLEVDPKTGKLRLSHKALLPKDGLNVRNVRAESVRSGEKDGNVRCVTTVVKDGNMVNPGLRNRKMTIRKVQIDFRNEYKRTAMLGYTSMAVLFFCNNGVSIVILTLFIILYICNS